MSSLAGVEFWVLTTWRYEDPKKNVPVGCQNSFSVRLLTLLRNVEMVSFGEVFILKVPSRD